MTIHLVTIICLLSLLVEIKPVEDCQLLPSMPVRGGMSAEIFIALTGSPPSSPKKLAFDLPSSPIRESVSYPSQLSNVSQYHPLLMRAQKSRLYATPIKLGTILRKNHTKPPFWYQQSLHLLPHVTIDYHVRKGRSHLPETEAQSNDFDF